MKKRVISFTVMLSLLLLAACSFQVGGNDSIGTETAPTAPTTSAVVSDTATYQTTVSAQEAAYILHFDENAVDLDLDEADGWDSINFDGYNVILLGEEHASSKQQDVFLSLLRHLNQRYGVRHIIYEGGYCDAIIMNHFLRTGDITLIEGLLSSYSGALASTMEAYNFWVGLYGYNQTLPEDERLQIVGIDIQFHITLGLEVLAGLFDTVGTIHPVVQEIAAVICAESPLPLDILSAYAVFLEHEEAFVGFFGPDYWDVYYSFRSIVQAVDYYLNNESLAVREAAICENFRDMYTEFEIDRCAGAFGSAHAILNGRLSGQKSLAHSLNTEFEPTMGKVLHIASIYENSFNLAIGTYALQAIVPLYGRAMNDAFLSAIEGEYGLCATQGLTFGSEQLDSKYQYLLLIQNSPACTPYAQN